jgi:hypothetical protein
MSVAASRRSSESALLAVLSDLTRKGYTLPPENHTRENQMRFCASSGSTSSSPNVLVIVACGNPHFGQPANFKLNSQLSAKSGKQARFSRIKIPLHVFTNASLFFQGWLRMGGRTEKAYLRETNFYARKSCCLFSIRVYSEGNGCFSLTQSTPKRPVGNVLPSEQVVVMFHRLLWGRNNK